MISKNNSAFANLPQEVMMKEYPKVSYCHEVGLNDTISGVDRQMNADVKNSSVKKGNDDKY